MRQEQTYVLGRVMSGGKEYTGYEMPFGNLYDTLSATAGRVPDRMAFIDDRRSVTFARFRQEVDVLASYLRDVRHISEGDRVGLVMVNSIEFCVSFYAVLKLGAIVVLVNTKMSADEMGFILSDSGSCLVISDTAWKDRTAEYVRSEQCTRGVLFTGAEYDGIIADHRVTDITPTSDDSLTAVIMYSSGTTGKPKGACLTHFNLMQGFYCYAKADDMDGHEITVAAVPLFHITGLNNILTLFVFLGGTTYLVPFFDAGKVLDMMTRSRCTYFHAVATVYIMLASAYDPSRHDLSCLTDAICGGGFITQESIRRFCSIAPSCRFHPVYGMTETAGTGTYSRGNCLETGIVDSCGQVSENCEIRIMDDDGNELPTMENGEICFRGAYIISHYLHNISTDSFQDGWLRSGDIGHFDESGNLYITDRKKDMINRGGEKIFSLAVESTIMEFGGIRQACVFAVRDTVYQEVPAAVIIPNDGCVIDIPQLRLFLMDKLAHYKVPVYIEIRDKVPTTANGKTRKNILRDEFNRKYGEKSI